MVSNALDFNNIIKSYIEKYNLHQCCIINRGIKLRSFFFSTVNFHLYRHNSGQLFLEIFYHGGHISSTLARTIYIFKWPKDLKEFIQVTLGTYRKYKNRRDIVEKKIIEEFMDSLISDKKYIGIKYNLR